MLLFKVCRIYVDEFYMAMMIIIVHVVSMNPDRAYRAIEQQDQMATHQEIFWWSFINNSSNYL